MRDLTIVALFSRGDYKAPTNHDLIQFFRSNIVAEPYTTLGWNVCDQLISSVDQMRAAAATHLLLIESDMRVPTDALKRLKRHNKPIIAANYWQRHQRSMAAGRGGTPITSEGRTGIEEVEYAGCGLMLIKAGVFDALPEPWFSQPWNQTHRAHATPDAYFCTLARACQQSVWIDHDLSQDVWHIGDVEFGVNQTRYLTSQLTLVEIPT